VHEELPILVEVLKRVYPQKEINVQLIIDENCEIQADRNDMLEVFGNLFDNAFKWSKSQIICRVASHDGTVINIEDDGIGCDKVQLDSLTQRGTQVDSHINGTGLGLAIVQDIVDLYKGEIIFLNSHLGGLSVQIKLNK
jgi:signal transduction histidine kinase